MLNAEAIYFSVSGYQPTINFLENEEALTNEKYISIFRHFLFTFSVKIICETSNMIVIILFVIQNSILDNLFLFSEQPTDHREPKTK